MDQEKFIEEISPFDDDSTLHLKMSSMSLEQLEAAANRYRRYVDISSIIEVFLMVKKLPSNMQMELKCNENGFYLDLSSRMYLVNSRSFPDKKVDDTLSELPKPHEAPTLDWDKLASQ